MRHNLTNCDIMPNLWTKNTLSDEKLLHDIKTWNTALFEIIYERRSKKIFSYLMTILNYNKEDANQLLWDIFISLYEYNKDNNIDNCKSFLYTTAHNKAIDHIKKKSEEYTTNKMENYIDESDLDHKDKINLTYKQELMVKYLEMLQPREKEIVHLYFYEDKSYEDIATILWTNKNTIWTMLLQAKKKLREFVDREWTKEILF